MCDLFFIVKLNVSNTVSNYLMNYKLNYALQTLNLKLSGLHHAAHTTHTAHIWNSWFIFRNVSNHTFCS